MKNRKFQLNERPRTLSAEDTEDISMLLQTLEAPESPGKWGFEGRLDPSPKPNPKNPEVVYIEDQRKAQKQKTTRFKPAM